MRWPFSEKQARTHLTTHADWLPVQSAETLLSKHQMQLQIIRRSVGVPDNYWHVYYQPCFDAFAVYVQQCPASEAHHHCHVGGMLEHSLDVVEHTLKLRQGKLLPTGADAEELARTHAIWTFAAVTAALYHDIGKPAVDLNITLFSADGRDMGQWSPWTNVGFTNIAWYRVDYKRKRQFGLHEQISNLLVTLLLPNHCLSWLSSDLIVIRAWSATLLGDLNKAGELGEMVHQADGLSVARNLSGQSRSIQIPSAKQVPLSERLITGLRYLLDNQKLPLNKDGAAGWLVGDELWLVVKRTLDDLKQHLASEGQTGIPGRNERLMDELQQNGLIVPNSQGRAIWKADVFAEQWSKSHTLTMLRFPAASIWPEPEARPQSFEGSITVNTDKSVDSGQKQNNAKLTTTEKQHSNDYSKVSQLKPKKNDNPEAIKGHQTIPETKDISLSESLPLPPPPEPTNDRCNPMFQDSHQNNITESNSQSDQNETEEDQGFLFLQWLRKGLKEKSLSINVVGARIHIVPEGVLLVSPGIFKDFDLARWSYVQKRFQKLKLNEKTVEKGENIHVYLVDGPRRKNRPIKGFLITDTDSVFPNISLPGANSHLRRKHRHE